MILGARIWRRRPLEATGGNGTSSRAQTLAWHPKSSPTPTPSGPLKFRFKTPQTMKEAKKEIMES